MPWIAEIFGLLFLFGCPAAYGITHQVLKHKERMQEIRNEELRLQIQLAQMRGERLDAQRTPLSSDPLPRDASWDDRVQTPYEMGYQQMEQQQ